LYDENEQYDVSEVIDGTSERQMRNQFNAWSKFMTLNMNNEVEAAE
jgi:hypothetical protein